jgi:hypothetical protein
VDPLRPFTDLVRSLWGNRTALTPRTESTGQARRLDEQPPPGTVVGATEDLRTRLRARLSQTGLADAGRAREIFVEVVLAWELGERVQGDPAFAGIVKMVAERIAERAELRGRLQGVLVSLVEGAR